jgi:ribonuclease HI
MNDFNAHTHWKRMRFKRNKVWVALDEDQKLRVEKGKVRVKYQLEQSHQYWVHADRVYELDAPMVDQNSGTPSVPPACEDHEPEAIAIYTDGACSGNPGPAGIGVVMVYKGHRKEIARHIGVATNNIAELEAVRLGLEAVKNRDLPVHVYTDSRYTWGLLSRNWKATENIALIEKIRRLTQSFRQLHFIKIKGHAGHPENERADRLAVSAIQKNRPKIT